MGSLAFDDSMAVGQMLDRRDSAVLDSLCRELLGQDSMDSDSLFRDITLPDVSRPPESSQAQVPSQCSRCHRRCQRSCRCIPAAQGGDIRRRIITYPGHKACRVCSSHLCAVMLIPPAGALAERAKSTAARSLRLLVRAARAFALIQ